MTHIHIDDIVSFKRGSQKQKLFRVRDVKLIHSDLSLEYKLEACDTRHTLTYTTQSLNDSGLVLISQSSSRHVNQYLLNNLSPDDYLESMRETMTAHGLEPMIDIEPELF